MCDNHCGGGAAQLHITATAPSVSGLKTAKPQTEQQSGSSGDGDGGVMRAILLGPDVAVMSRVPVLSPVSRAVNKVSQCPEKPLSTSTFTIENLRHLSAKILTNRRL